MIMKPLTLPQIILLIIGFVLFIAIGLTRGRVDYPKAQTSSSPVYIYRHPLRLFQSRWFATNICFPYQTHDVVDIEYQAEPNRVGVFLTGDMSMTVYDGNSGCPLESWTQSVIWLNPILEHSEILREIKKN